MKKILLLGALYAGLTTTTAAQAQLLGALRGSVLPASTSTMLSMPPASGSTDMLPPTDGPAPNPGTPMPEQPRGPLRSLLGGGEPIEPLPGLNEAISGVVAFGDDVIVRVGGVIGPAPTPVIPIPELGSQLPAVFGAAEQVIVRVGGVIGPAPTPVIPIPELGSQLPAVFGAAEQVIVRVGGVIGPAPTPVIPVPSLRPRNPA